MNRTATLSPGRSLAESVAIACALLACFVAIASLRSWTAQLGALQALAWAACAALAVAFVRLPKWDARRDVAIVVAVAALLRLTVLHRPPELSDDLWRYVWDGRVTLAGVNPRSIAAA